jgi:hypothetical protein
LIDNHAAARGCLVSILFFDSNVSEATGQPTVDAESSDFAARKCGQTQIPQDYGRFQWIQIKSSGRLNSKQSPIEVH